MAFIKNKFTQLTAGNQNISGVKTFADTIQVSGTGIFKNLDLSNLDDLTLSGIDLNIYDLGNVDMVGVDLTIQSGHVSSDSFILKNNFLQSSQASGYLTGIGYSGNYDGGYFLGRTKLSENTSRLVDSSFGDTWIAKENNRNWHDVAISSDGKHMTAVAIISSSPTIFAIFVSSDYGNTWIQVLSSTVQFYRVAMSTDGKYQSVIAVNNGQIYVSSDYGNSWTAKDSERLWTNISMNSDGKYQSATTQYNGSVYGLVYISSDYGNTWTPKQPALNINQFKAIAINSDGKYQTTVDANGKIYVSSDYGNSWTAKGLDKSWIDVAMSSDGRYQTAIVFGEKIYISSDYGNSWNNKETNRNWFSISISSDGKYQTAVGTNIQIYVSTNYGNSWIPKGNSRTWRGVSISSNGKYQTAVGTNIQIYVSKTDELIDGNLYADNLVYNTGNQTISGVKTFQSGSFDLLTINGQTNDGDYSARINFVDSNYGSIDVSQDGNFKLRSSAGSVNINTAGQITAGGSSTYELGQNLNVYKNVGYDYVGVNWFNKSITFADSLDNEATNYSNTIYYFKSGVSGYIPIDSEVVHNTGNQTISGVKTFANNLIVSETGIFNALDINNIDNLSLSGVDITITSGNVSLTNPVTAPNLIYNTGNQTISGVKTFVDDIKISGSNFTLTNSNINFSGNNINFENQNNINLAYQFPAYTGTRRYSPLDFYNATTTNGIVVSGAVNYFPFLIKKKVTNPQACIDMTLYASANPKVVIGIYSGNYGFENAKLITSGFINGNSLNTGIYRTTLNGTFNQGPYILASMLETGAGSTFRVIGSNGFREHFGISTGSNIIHGVNSTALTNVIADTGVSALPQNISSATWYANTATNCSPLVFLEY
jgi:hypothetical protein